MTHKNFTTAFSVDQSPTEVFAAITHVSGWWSRTLEGRSKNTGDEFVYRHKDIHCSKQKLTEVIPGKKMVWLVLEAQLNFARNKTEWKGTEICFEIVENRNKTELHFTHVGLTDACECFGACSRGWKFYINDSLRALIATGTGRPDF